MPDLDEPTGEYVQQKAANELDRVEFGFLDLVAVLRITPAESNHSVFQADQATIGDGDSVREARQVFQNVLGSSKWRFDTHDPFPLADRCEPVLEPHRMCEFLQGTAELQLPVLEGTSHISNELAAKEAAEWFLRQKEPFS